MIPCPHGFTVCQVRWEARQVEGAQQSIHLQKVGARLAFLRDAVKTIPHTCATHQHLPCGGCHANRILRVLEEAIAKEEV